MLTSTALRTPLFRVVKDGAPLPPATYTRSGSIGGVPLTGVVDAARVAAAFEDGATLVLQGAHRYWPPLARFVRELELTLGFDCQVNAYITPPGAQGLGVHSDAHDVFVLQAFGAKSWEVHEPGGQARELDLHPGDTLYLPKGTPHAARTQDVLSGHLTVGVLPRTWGDLLDEVVRRLRADPGYDEPLPPGYPTDPDGLAVQVGQRLAEVARAVDKTDPVELAQGLADRFLTTRLPVLTGALLDRVALLGLTGATPLRRRAGSVLVLRPAPPEAGARQLRVLLGDRELRVPAWLEPALRVVAASDSLTADDLAGFLDADSRLVLVRRLVREGTLEVAVDR